MSGRLVPRILGNRFGESAKHAAHFQNSAHDARFLWNNMWDLETTAESFYFDASTHDNFVMGYTDDCNVTELGVDSCVVDAAAAATSGGLGFPGVTEHGTTLKDGEPSRGEDAL